MERSIRGSAGVALLLAAVITRHAGADDRVEPTRAAPRVAPPATLTAMEVSFKLDPRLTRSLYMGDRWVSPVTYSRIQDGKDLLVDARAHGLTATTNPIPVGATWASDHPEVVSLSRRQGHEVTLTIHRVGRATITAAYGGFSKKLTARVVSERGVLRVDIGRD